MANQNKNKNYQSPLERDPIMKQKLLHFRKYLEKKNVVEVRINRPRQVILTFNNGTKEIKEDNDLDLNYLQTMAEVLANITGQNFSEKSPILSAKLPAGHRVQIVAFDAVATEFAMSIRIQQNREFSLDDFNVPKEEQKKIKDAIKSKKTILVSGGTGTGKTSFTNSIVKLIPLEERIITIEGVAELMIPHEDWVAMTYSENQTSSSGVTAEGQLRASLRMCPDRILLGEIHTENAPIFVNAINTGHDGSIATIHANSPKGAIAAILAKMVVGGMDEGGLNIMEKQLLQDVHVIIQLNHDKKTGKRTTIYKETKDLENIDLTNEVKEYVKKEKTHE